MAVPGHAGIWACGDCAAVPSASGKLCPPTAQHAVRQGVQAARNIAVAVRGEPAKIRPYRYAIRGQFAAIGRRRAVATLFGVRFSGFIAWLMWRGAYLWMLPAREESPCVHAMDARDLLRARHGAAADRGERPLEPDR